MRKIKPFIAGAVFMVTVGFVDNLFLIIGMEGVNNLLPPINQTINGAIGNTISDAIGVIIGATVSYYVSKLLGIREENTTFSQQLTGIVLGCLLPILIYLLIK